MTDQQRKHLINEPEHGYRALFNGCQDAILVAPTGDIIATFTSIDDAMHTADVLNTEHANADALATAATALERILSDAHIGRPRDFLAYGAGQNIRKALEAINAAPARKVIKPASGVGESRS